MIGTDLNLDLPSLSDTLVVAMGKVIQCFSDIEDSIADKATPAGLDITTSLSFGGNPITSLGYATFADGNNPTAAGSAYYDSGDFYLITAAGTVRLTASGGVNAAGIGGIGGDYGGANPALVEYDDAPGEFIFTEDTGVYADLVCDDVVLWNNAGTFKTRLTAHPTLAASYTVTLPAAVPSETTQVRMDSSGNLTVGRQSLSKMIPLPGWFNRTTSSGASDTNSFKLQNNNGTGPFYWETSTTGMSAVILLAPVELPEGCVITSFNLYLKKNSNASTTLQASLASVGTTGTTSTIVSVTDASNAGGDLTKTSATISETVGSSKSYLVYLHTSGNDTPNAADRFYGLKVNYTTAL